METATKQIIAITIVVSLVGFAVIIYYDQKNPEAEVVSSIDNIGYRIDAKGSDYLNVTLEISVVIENYGRLKQMEIPCSTIQSYLQVKNSTTPIQPLSDGLVDNSSYILDDTFLTHTCDNITTRLPVSENVVNQLVAEVPFMFLSGEYNFVWIHSFADSYQAGTVVVDALAGTVTTSVEYTSAPSF